LDLVCFVWVRWFWGLTCDFAGEFGFYFEVGFARGQNDKQEQEQEQEQRQKQKQKQIQGFFASLRMTTSSF
jgi:hypothetical protein